MHINIIQQNKTLNHKFSQLARHERVSVITLATVYGSIDIISSSESLLFMLYLTLICSVCIQSISTCSSSWTVLPHVHSLLLRGVSVYGCSIKCYVQTFVTKYTCTFDHNDMYMYAPISEIQSIQKCLLSCSKRLHRDAVSI